MAVQAIDIDKLENLFSEMDILGIKYGLGTKVPYLDIEPDKIKKIDCSGFIRYALYKATDGKLKIPDGSFYQREWCEKEKLKQIKYSDLQNMADRKLYIGFIRAGHNGCGKVGHVWPVTRLNNDSIPDTMELHGGVGVDSRRWDYLTLKKQVYSCFELPVK